MSQRARASRTARTTARTSAVLKRVLCVALLVGTGVASGARAAPDSPRIAELAWLAGCWIGEGGEECWLEPLGGTMVGINRGPQREGKPPAFEFLRLVEDGGKLVYLASPSGRHPPTPFEAIEVGERRVVFANPDHDFPQRITYWIEEPDGRESLHARVEARQDGEWQGFETTWTRGVWSAR